MAAIVRLADELDEDYRRAPEAARAISQLDDSPYWHFCSVITGVTPRRFDRSQEIEIDVRLAVDDFVRTFNGEKEEAFLRFFADKLTKLNDERKYCNQFLPESLRVVRISVRYRGFSDLEPFRMPSTATLEDGSPSEAVLAPLSGPVEMVVARKVREAKALLTAGNAADAYTAFHSVYRASEGFPTSLRRERLRALYNMACACSRQATDGGDEAQRWLDLGVKWLSQWIREGVDGGWRAAGDSQAERVEALRLDDDLRALRDSRSGDILNVLPPPLQAIFRGSAPRPQGSGGGGGGGCLALGTLLLCPGGERPVQDLRVGDQVMSFDDNSGRLIVVRVDNISWVDDVTTVVINRALTVSRPQRLLTPDGSWITAQEVIPGMHLMGLGPAPLQIDSVDRGEPMRVFELRTDHFTHNIVSQGAVLHNVKMRIP